MGCGSGWEHIQHELAWTVTKAAGGAAKWVFPTAPTAKVSIQHCRAARLAGAVQMGSADGQCTSDRVRMGAEGDLQRRLLNDLVDGLGGDPSGPR
jgi:hypothetical protein